MIKYILIVTSLFTIAACGGGGGDIDNTSVGLPTDPNQVFDLTELYSTTQGTTYTTTLTGSDSDGVTYSGTFSIVNQADVMLNGSLITPHDFVINLNSGGLPIEVTGSNSIDSSGIIMAKTVQSTGLSCTPNSPDSMPNLVTVGDSGTRSTLMCNDNTTSEVSWRILDGGNERVKVVSTATVKDQFNTVISVTDVTFMINSNGEIVSFKTVATVASNNYKITYQSI